MTKKVVIINILICFISIACTENPFLDSNITEDGNRSFSGKVLIENDSDPSGIFVWIEELNLFTWTKTNGEFLFVLPAKAESQPGGGFTGFLTVYYYVANYKLESSRVFVFDGVFKYADADLNEKGQIKDTIVLEKKLNIVTTVVPSLFSTTYTDIIQIKATLTTPENDPVRAGTNKNRYGEWTGIFIKSISDPGMDIIRIIDGGMREDIVTGEITWKKTFYYSDLNLNPGKYEVIPFVIVNENLPTGLLTAIGENVRSFSENYFNYPIRVETATIEISD